jgi:hypothetical protein
MAKPHENPHDLFWKKVNKTDGCWEWTGNVCKNGYGKFQLTLPRPDGLTPKDKTPQRTYRAPRYAWEMVNGPIADGLLVCHKCDNPKCVRIDHLFLGTQLVNRRDAANKGRTARGERSPNSVLTSDKVQEIRSLLGTRKLSAIAKQFNVSVGAIDAIRTGKTWGHLGKA